jgi:hypothetical protein
MKVYFGISLFILLTSSCEQSKSPKDIVRSNSWLDTLKNIEMAEIRYEKVSKSDSTSLLKLWNKLAKALKECNKTTLKNLSFDTIYCQACNDPFLKGTNAEDIFARPLTIDSFVNIYLDSLSKIRFFKVIWDDFAFDPAVQSIKRPGNFTYSKQDTIMSFWLRIGNSYRFQFMKAENDIKFYGIYL